jgi:Tol biopolymer transport system component
LEQATLFQPGVISTDAPEFALTLSPDGRELFFNRASPDRSQLIIYRSTFSDGRWSAPTVASFSGGSARDVDPIITPQGDRLYFSSNRPTSATDTTPDFNTWFVERSGSGWSAPQQLGAPVDSEGSDVFVSAARDGTLYISSNRDGTSRIYSSRWLNGQFQPVQIVPVDVNVAEGANNPAINPANAMLVFVSGRAGGSGNSDLWVSCRTERGWTPAQNLGMKVNSLFADFAPSFSADGTTLYFTSERPGLVGPQPEGVRPPGDLYRIQVSALPVRCG